MTQAITSTDASRNSLLMIAAGGLLSGVLTPLAPQLIDRISGGPGDFRIALVAVPFAVLVFFVVRRCRAMAFSSEVDAGSREENASAKARGVSQKRSAR